MTTQRLLIIGLVIAFIAVAAMLIFNDKTSKGRDTAIRAEVPGLVNQAVAANPAVSSLTQRMDGLKLVSDGHQQRLDAQADALRENGEADAARDSRLDAHDQQLTAVSGRLDQHRDQLADHDRRLDGHDQQLRDRPVPVPVPAPVVAVPSPVATAAVVVPEPDPRPVVRRTTHRRHQISRRVAPSVQIIAPMSVTLNGRGAVLMDAESTPYVQQGVLGTEYGIRRRVHVDAD